MDEIIREPTKDESRDFEPIMRPGGLIKSPHQLFEERLGKEAEKAMKKELPFARVAAREEYKDKLENWEKQFKRQGYATSKKPTFDDIDWSKYGDVKNFEVLEEGNKRDDYLSKVHKVPVFTKYKVYRYKGFSNTYTVMEDPEKALSRALDSINSRAPRTTK